MDLKNQTSDAWAKKTDAELRELISEGVKEINERRKSIKSKSELEFIKRIEKLQGTTKTGDIRRTTPKLTSKELRYRARMINQFLDVDTSSKEFKQNFKASVNEARMTFNERYKMNLTKEEYAEMVELMGAFKDNTQAFGSSQIAEFYSYAKQVKVDTDELPRIFGEAVQMKSHSVHQRMEYVFDRIDELSGINVYKVY